MRSCRVNSGILSISRSLYGTSGVAPGYYQISRRLASSGAVRQSSSNEFDVVIVGGVSGISNKHHLLADIKRIALCERRSGYALVASHLKNNSQTIHCGDIETNYTPETAVKVKRSANMLRNCLTKIPENDLYNIARKGQKMVIGVGDSECQYIKDRYAPFKQIFPTLQLLDKNQVHQVEPNVVRGLKGGMRPEDVNALYVNDELTTCNFMALSEHFVKAANHDGKELQPMLNTEVKNVTREGSTYKVTTNNGTLSAKFVVFSACGYSLLFAQRMGIGLEYSVLPVAGSFYFAPNVLQGKVYTVQNPALPFAAVHGDPDIGANNETRFGPTALPLPLLERYNMRSLPDFLRVLRLDTRVMAVYLNLLGDRTIRNYMLRNFLFEVPLLSRLLFLKDARKIVPSLTLKDLRYSVGYGGVRPQLVDKVNKKLLLGQSKLSNGEGCIYNITASPGATTCVSNAEIDMREICAYIGATIDENKLKQHYFEGEYAI
ncbi:malate:quinone oxidoreductase, putative [Babesia bigemina]|uniref:Malate:quinone oxidoreductase, putative n=1 Tax=Babesia bigemina TaxID=5866 RepID=A0A061DDI9_BABBI|nr:malate:quinone oxidoreductase, putative [Babesia bigemina]CDR96290.1 malate:quinone oxidoreductase, putative [Babesia bigemina]|eukprot:XP_012768476.1 malate:quinone oxidoreductase, putative [Babesia bigemina]